LIQLSQCQVQEPHPLIMVSIMGRQGQLCPTTFICFPFCTSRCLYLPLSNEFYTRKARKSQFRLSSRCLRPSSWLSWRFHVLHRRRNLWWPQSLTPLHLSIPLILHIAHTVFNLPHFAILACAWRTLVFQLLLPHFTTQPLFHPTSTL
jgi:hypothetical protein